MTRSSQVGSLVQTHGTLRTASMLQSHTPWWITLPKHLYALDLRPRREHCRTGRTHAIGKTWTLRGNHCGSSNDSAISLRHHTSTARGVALHGGVQRTRAPAAAARHNNCAVKVAVAAATPRARQQMLQPVPHEHPSTNLRARVGRATLTRRNASSCAVRHG